MPRLPANARNTRALLVLLLAAACGTTTSTGTGEVVRVEPDRSAIVVRRDDIPGMTSAPAVRMTAPATGLAAGVEPGARVRFVYARRLFGDARLVEVDLAGPGPAQMHDHTPHHGGVVTMVGARHVEARASADGRVEVWLTDFFRRALPVAELRGTAALDADGAAHSVALAPESGALVGRGAPIGAARAAVRVTIDLAEGPLAARFVLPVAPGATGVASIAQTRCTPGPPGGPRCTLDFGEPVTALAISPDGATLLAAVAGGAVSVWRLPDGTLAGGIDPAPPVAVPRGEAPHAEIVSRIAWRPDGTEAAIVLEGRVLRYAIPGGRLVRVLGGPGDVVRDVAWWPDGSRLVTTAYHDPEARVVDADTGRTVARYEVKLEGSAIAVEPGGETVLVGSGAGTITRFRARDGKRLAVFAASSGAVVSLAPLGDRLVVLTLDGALRALGAGDGRPVATLQVGSTPARFAAGGGGRVAVGLPDGRVVVADALRGAVERTIEASAAPILAVAWRGSTLVTGDAKGRVALWDAGG